MKPWEKKRLDRILYPDLFPSFHAWLKATSPELNWDFPHMVYLADILQRVADGELKKVIINLPPQHGKSSIVTRFVAYMIECDPAIRVMLGAYSVDLVQDFSVTIRDITRLRGKVRVRNDSDAKGHWKTNRGGQVHAVSVGGAATGNPSDLTVIDDPHKDQQDADSKASRDALLKTYRTAWMNRLSKNGIMLVVHTRWREDDLSGYLLTEEQAEGWQRFNLPAIAEKDDPLGRLPGEALCPDLHPIEQLESFRRRSRPHEFQGIYQGDPTNEHGDLFKVNKIRYLDRWPTKSVDGKLVKLKIEWVRAWDRAGTEGGGDYSVGILVGLDELGQWHFKDCVYGQWDDLGVDKAIDETAARDGPDVRIKLQQDPAAAGKADTARIARRLNAKGYSVYHDRPTGAKEVRARGLSVIVANEDLFFWRDYAWNEFVMSQMRAAPNGKNDDAWDAASDAVNFLSEGVDLSPYIERFESQTSQGYGLTPEGLPEGAGEAPHWLLDPGDTKHVWQCEGCKAIQSPNFIAGSGDRCVTCKGGSFIQRRLD